MAQTSSLIILFSIFKDGTKLGEYVANNSGNYDINYIIYF